MEEGLIFIPLSVVLFKSIGWLLVLLDLFMSGTWKMTIICVLWQLKCSTDFHPFLASWMDSLNPDNRCQVGYNFLWTYKTYMKKNIHYMLARGDSEWNQGPNSTYKPYVNISLGRRNFMVVEKNSTYREAKGYCTMSFLFVHLSLWAPPVTNEEEKPY